MSTTDLVTINNDTQLTPHNTSYVESGLDSVRLKPTELVLIQNTTQNMGAARPGQFLDKTFDVAYDEVPAVILDFWYPKVLFPPGQFVSGVKPICRSNDGIVPSPYVETPQSSSCKGCVHNIWKKAPGGKSIPPDCRDKLRMLLIMTDSMLPRMITFTGKSITSAKMFLEAIKQQQVIAKFQRNVIANLHDFTFLLKADRVPGPSGVGYVARFASAKLKDAEIGKFDSAYHAYVSAYRNSSEEGEEGAAPVESKPAEDGLVHEAEIVSEV